MFKFGIAGIISGLISLISTGAALFGGFLLVSYFTKWVPDVQVSQIVTVFVISAVLYVVAGVIAFLGFHSATHTMDRNFKASTRSNPPTTYPSW